MRSLSTTEANSVSGGGLGLGLLAGVTVALPPLLKVSVGALLGVSTCEPACAPRPSCHPRHC